MSGRYVDCLRCLRTDRPHCWLHWRCVCCHFCAAVPYFVCGQSFSLRRLHLQRPAPSVSQVQTRHADTWTALSSRATSASSQGTPQPHAPSVSTRHCKCSLRPAPRSATWHGCLSSARPRACPLCSAGALFTCLVSAGTAQRNVARLLGQREAESLSSVQRRCALPFLLDLLSTGAAQRNVARLLGQRETESLSAVQRRCALLLVSAPAGTVQGSARPRAFPLCSAGALLSSPAPVDTARRKVAPLLGAVLVRSFCCLVSAGTAQRNVSRLLLGCVRRRVFLLCSAGALLLLSCVCLHRTTQRGAAARTRDGAHFLCVTTETRHLDRLGQLAFPVCCTGATLGPCRRL